MFTRYETDRLQLRVCDRTQASLILNFYTRNFEEFSRYEPLRAGTMTLQYFKNLLQYERRMFDKEEFLRLYIFEKKNPMTIIGTLSYRSIQRGSSASCILGYKMDAGYRRRGYCREAIACGNRIMFEELSLHRIEAYVMPDNEASIRLLESLHFSREGLLREKTLLNGVWQDHYLYALLAHS